MAGFPQFPPRAPIAPPVSCRATGRYIESGPLQPIRTPSFLRISAAIAFQRREVSLASLPCPESEPGTPPAAEARSALVRSARSSSIAKPSYENRRLIIAISLRWLSSITGMSLPRSGALSTRELSGSPGSLQTSCISQPRQPDPVDSLVIDRGRDGGRESAAPRAPGLEGLGPGLDRRLPDRLLRPRPARLPHLQRRPADPRPGGRPRGPDAVHRRRHHEGQQIFLHNGFMEYGSIFGHGAYLGPDFTADYLHRAAESVERSTAARGSDRALRADDRRLQGQSLRRATGHAHLHRAAGRRVRGRSSATTPTSSRTRRPSRACARRRSPTRTGARAHRLL